GSIKRRIVLLTPSERPELPELKAAGFTSYLVKPVRAASLAARFTTAVAADTDMADDTTPRAVTAPGDGLTVLFPGEHAINALRACARPPRLGHRPVVVANGVLALDACSPAAKAGARYDLILMDVHIPELDGLEATSRIRTTEAAMRLPRTRIV